MLDRGLQPELSSQAQVELKAMGDAAPEPEPGAASEIRDLRQLLWCSIDNDDSRDLDQLSVAEERDAGVKILVAVADVDALVKQGSAIDQHAQANTTSVYTAAQIFPMLPERISTDLTSLNAGQERLVMVVEFVVASDGTVGESQVYRARVFNRAKLAYNSVAAWLDGRAAAPLALTAVAGLGEQLRLQDRVAQSLRRLRHQHGALSLQTVEARPVFEGEEANRERRVRKSAAALLLASCVANGFRRSSPVRLRREPGSESSSRLPRGSWCEEPRGWTWAIRFRWSFCAPMWSAALSTSSEWEQPGEANPRRTGPQSRITLSRGSRRRISFGSLVTTT